MYVQLIAVKFVMLLMFHGTGINGRNFSVKNGGR